VLFFETLKDLLTQAALYFRIKTETISTSENMSANVKATPDDIEMSSIFGALKRSLPKLLLTSTALAGATFGVLMMIAPKYQSEAELAIVARSASSGFTDPKSQSAGPDSVTTKMDKEAINTHVRALKSTDLLGKIADQMALKEKREFNAVLGPVDQVDSVLRLAGVGGPRSGESERDRVLNTLRNQLEVYSAKESRFIGVRMTSIEPELAAKIANAVAETYRSSLANESVVEIDSQQTVLQGKIDKLSPEMAAIETEVEQFRGKINSFKAGAQNTDLRLQQMSELNGELSKAQAARAESDARAKSAKEMMKVGTADALPDVQKSPLIQNLVQQRVRIERQISELSASLLPGHPRMQQLNADLAGLKKQLNGEIAKLVDSLEKEAKIAQGREESIKKSLDEIKSKVVTNAPEEAKLAQLEANAKAKRTELENLRMQLETNRKKTDSRAAPIEVKIISEAQPASVPIFPKKVPLSALVGIAALIFGAAWTVLRALFTGARSGGASSTSVALRAKGAASQRAEPVLAAAPAPKAPEKKSTPAAQSNSETAMADLVQRLVSKRQAEGGHRTILTGETTQIDPGVEAIDLAKALSETGATVVLVDWSPSGKGISKVAGVSNARGLTELLLGDVSFDDAVNRLPSSSVHFIGSGAPLDETDVDIEPDQLNLVLDALDEAYDHIIVVGGQDDARFLFEAIQGRFDAGVLIADAKKRASVLDDPAGTFLGFEVADIDVIRFERSAQPQAVGQRIVRATRANGGEVRPI
jgi:polysaccharide biosynthesis transport protein